MTENNNITDTNRIVLLHTERSGSNLTRSILGNHSHIHSPTPPNLISPFSKIIGLYGDLNNDKSFANLCEDIIYYLQNRHTKWNVTYDADYLFNKVPKRSLMSVIDTVYQEELIKSKKTIVFIKEIKLDKHFFHFYNTFSNSKFIYLIRDGRDAVTSAMTSSSFNTSADLFADRWNSEQIAFLSIYKTLKAQNKIIPVYYEDLLTEPEKLVKDICKFLNVDFEDNMLNFFKHKGRIEESKIVHGWKNLSSPILQNNFEKYKNYFSKRELFKIESKMFMTLCLLGYEPQNDVLELSKKRRSIIKKYIKMIKSFIPKGDKEFRKERLLRMKTYQIRNSFTKKLIVDVTPVIKPKYYQPS